MKSVFQHVGAKRFLRVLDDSQSATVPDRSQARGAIVQLSREDNPGHSRAVVPGRRAKQGIDGRAVTVFARTAADGYGIAFQQEMEIGRRNVNDALSDLFVFAGMMSGELACGTQNLRQNAGVIR